MWSALGLYSSVIVSVILLELSVSLSVMLVDKSGHDPS